MGQRKVERVRERIAEGGAAENTEAEEEEGGEEVVSGLDNLSIETAVTEEEAAEGFEVALATQEMEVEGDRESEGGAEYGGTLRALRAL